MATYSSPATPHTLKILLVDDQKFVQHKLRQMLSTQADLKIVGIASDGETAIAKVASLRPNVVLIDIEMPRMNGIEAAKIISQRFPDCKILILSSYEHQEYVQKIIAAGADGYILKNTPPEDLVTAIHSVCKGYSHFGSQLLKKIQLADQINTADAAKTENSPLIAFHNSPISAPHSPQLAPPANELLPPVSKWLTWGGISIIAIIISAIPATAIFKYKTVVKAQAIARPASQLHLVQAAMAGQIAQILVKEGQTVQQGQAIATIEPSRFQTQQNQLKTAIRQQKLQLPQLKAEIANLATQIIAETERNQSEVAAANFELNQSQRNYQTKKIEVKTQVNEFQAQVKAVAATLNAAKVKYNRYQSVAQAGAIGKEQLAEAELEVKRQEQELAAAQARLKRAIAALNPSTAEIAISQQRIEQAEKSGQAMIAGLNREKKTLIQQRLKLLQQLEQDVEQLNQVNQDLTQTKIIATATGTIFQLDLRNQGQTVYSGQEVAQIIPNNFQLEMKAAIAPQDISKLKVGQEVQMRVSACPYPDYGTLQGEVRQIARDTRTNVQGNHNSSSSTATTHFYEVIITPDNNTFGRGHNQCLLQLGMESQAQIISREETVLQFIRRKARLTTNL